MPISGQPWWSNSLRVSSDVLPWPGLCFLAWGQEASSYESLEAVEKMYKNTIKKRVTKLIAPILSTQS